MANRGKRVVLFFAALALLSTLVWAAGSLYADPLYLGSGSATDVFIYIALSAFNSKEEWIKWDEAADRFEFSNDVQIDKDITVGVGADEDMLKTFDNGGVLPTTWGWDSSSEGLKAYTGFGVAAGSSHIILDVANTGGTTTTELDCITNSCTVGGGLLITGTTAMTGAFTAIDGTFSGDVIFDSAGDADFRGTITGADVSAPIVFSSYIGENTRFLDHRFHGNFISLDTGSAIDNGPTNITVTPGIGKLVLVLNTCSDAIGTITATGTSVNRDTGAETGSDTDAIQIVNTSTDSTSTDAQGNSVWAMSDVYMTSKWFTGSVTFTTSDVTCTDVDTYQIAFEQVNDQPSLVLSTLDVTADITNANGWLYAYAYLIEKDSSGGKTHEFNITNPGTVSIASPTANKTYRLRNGAIADAFDGTTDGFWVEAHFGGSPSSYIENFNLKVWVDQTIDVDGAAE